MTKTNPTKKRFPKYVRSFVDRHGCTRTYFTRNGKNVPLPGVPWSRTFMRSYKAALSEAERKA